jgi:hypothetical protein
MLIAMIAMLIMLISVSLLPTKEQRLIAATLAWLLLSLVLSSLGYIPFAGQ